jgi:hypothetical protein
MAVTNVIRSATTNATLIRDDVDGTAAVYDADGTVILTCGKDDDATDILATVAIVTEDDTLSMHITH